MKLVMLTAGLDPSNQAEGFIVDWVEALAKEVEYLTVIVTKKPHYTLLSKNASVIYLQQKGKIRRLLELWQHLRQLKKNGSVDGLFTHIFNFLGIVGGLWGKCHKVKTIMWFAGGTPMHLFDPNWLALSLNDVVVTCSTTEKRRYQKILGKRKKIRILGQGINSDRFNMKRSKHPSPKITIGYAARATPMKKFETLIEAVNLLAHPSRYELRLALADCSVHPDYVRHIQSLSKLSTVNVKLHLNISYQEIPNFYHQLDLYVHPSTMLSMDKSALEAIISGLPALLSSYGFNHIMTENALSLFDPYHPSQLAEKIHLALSHTAAFQIEQQHLRNHVLKNYTLPVLMHKLVATFHDETLCAV